MLRGGRLNTARVAVSIGFALAFRVPVLQADLCLGPEQCVQASGQDIAVPGYSVPSFVDWNNDGLPDLIVGEGGSPYSGRIRIYLNVGTSGAPLFGDFSYAQSNGSDLTESPGFCLGVFPRVVYWDADGRKDLMIGLADGTVKIYLNVNTDEEPRFDGGTLLLVGEPGSKVAIDVGLRATPIVNDWNEDGRKDLVIGAYDGKIHIFLNVGSDTSPDFRTETLAQADGQDLIVLDTRSSPHMADLDGDGRKDLLSGNTEGELLFYRNVGTNEAPAFSGYTNVAANGVPIDLPYDARSRPFVCDWNLDGLPDVLLGGGDGKVRRYLGVPPPGDIDGDGDVDSDDLNAFVAVLIGASFDPLQTTRSDLNHDGTANGEDIQLFVSLLLSP